MTSILIDKSAQVNHVHRIYLVPTFAMPVLLPINNCFKKYSNSKMNFKYYKIPKKNSA